MLKGKRIAVTGAAGRLGSRLSAALHKRGATVLSIVLNGEEKRSLPGDAHAFVGDVTSESDAEQIFQSIQEEVGGLDGLVHTVGGWSLTPLLETTAPRWRSLVDLNLTSTFLCFREAGKLMVEGEGGALVAIAAGQGVDRGVAQQSAYSAAKGGVARLVEAADAELRGSGVRAGAVAPSMILFGDEDSDDGVPVADVVQACLALLDGEADGSIRREYGSLG